MGLKVPDYDNQETIKSVQLSTLSAGNVAAPDVIRAAFGEDVARADQALGEVGDKLAKAMIQRAQERQRELKVRENLEKDTVFGLALQDELYDKEVDDRGRPRGLLNRKLEQAHGITDEFNKIYFTMRKRTLDSVSDLGQQNVLAKMLDTRFEAIQNRIINHEVHQTDESIKLAHESSLTLQENEAAQLQDSVSLSKAINKGVATQEALNRFMGYDPETSKVKNSEIMDRIVKSAINSQLLSNPATALELLNGIKDKISADKYRELRKETETGFINYDIQRDTSTDTEESFVYKQLQLEDKGYYNFLSAEARTKALEESQLKIGRNKRMSDYMINKNQNQNESKMLVDWIDGKASPEGIKNAILSGSVRRNFGEKLFKNFYADLSEHTDFSIYNKIREMQLSNTTPQEINQTILDNADKINDKDKRFLIEKTLSETDIKRNAQIRYNAGALKVWAGNELGRIGATPESENSKLSNDIVYEFHRRVNESDAQSVKVDEIAQELVREKIKEFHPQTALIEDVPNFVANRNRIKKLYGKNSKLKGTPVKMQPINVITNNDNGINFYDL